MNQLNIERKLIAAAAPVLAVPVQDNARRLLPGVSRQLADVHHD